MNQEQSLEAKGKEAKDFLTFNSFVINNNAPSDVKVEWNDRRFSVPDLNTKKLEDEFGNEWVDAFKLLVTDHDGDHYRQLGSWIYWNAQTDKYSMNYVHRGERFEQMVLSTLEPWQMHFRLKHRGLIENDLLHKYKTQGVKIDYFKKNLPKGEKWPQDMASVDSFLEKFQDRDRNRIGSLHYVVEENDSGYMEEVAKIFHPSYVPFRDNDDDIFDLL